MTKAPKCKLCGSHHWAREPHVWADEPKPQPRKSQPMANAKAETVANMANEQAKVVAMANASTYRYRNPEKRREYQARLMKARRAAAKFAVTI